MQKANDQIMSEMQVDIDQILASTFGMTEAEAVVK
jgi:hypothetical protein